MEAIKQILAVLVVVGLVGCAMVACPNTSGKPPAPTTTPEPNGSAGAVGAVMAGLEPVLDAAGRSIDAGTDAVKSDTRTAHPLSTAEQWGATLTTLCVVGLVVVGLSFVAVVWLVLKSGLVAYLIRVLEARENK